ncbi:hypothetical protein Sps_03533 [Shewanella psychrophila]|uniref:Uncharacterized protein n=1 Tax=Shewanella psychrophila TaxID=225848 RepID=A0A1S6HSX8_9GAMM|nr:hypothetical protein [Shewanella psychrophila]AQS38660.1 hypothetical protein Sps_03533 [Shewanella psychrophila]
MKRIDYLVKVTLLPEDLKQASNDHGCELFRIYQIYQRLIESHLLWKVWLIDEFDYTWVEMNFINDDGEPEFHTIKLDEGTYERVEFDTYPVLDSLA